MERKVVYLLEETLVDSYHIGYLVIYRWPFLACHFRMPSQNMAYTHAYLETRLSGMVGPYTLLVLQYG